MSMVQAIGMIAVSLLFGMVGWYLTLIAKFYRQKFFKGPPYRYMQLSLAALTAGLLLELPWFPVLPGWIPALLVCAGGLTFSALSYRLYKTMMSVE